MQIRIDRPEIVKHDAPATWHEMCFVVNARRAEVLELAERAFRHRDRKAWEQIQRALYVWNTEDLERTLHPTGFASMAHRTLRNMVVALENVYRPHHELECRANFSIEAALEELYNAATSHRINNHPFLKHLETNGLAPDHIRLFLDNYYVNNRLFHLHIATLSCTTPLRRRNDLYANLHDELGGEDAHLAHPLLFLRNYDTLGPSKEITPLPESLYLLNTKVALTHLSDDCLQGFGGLGFIEIAMPRQMRSILNGLRRSGMSDRDLIFWETHIKIDEEHGRNWFAEMREMITGPQDAEALLNGGNALLDARALVYDGIWRAVQESEMQQVPVHQAVNFA
jgi:pyrroloquinoline-quinone synthase